MENIQELLCEMQIQGQTHQAAASLKTILSSKSFAISVSEDEENLNTPFKPTKLG